MFPNPSEALYEDSPHELISYSFASYEMKKM